MSPVSMIRQAIVTSGLDGMILLLHRDLSHRIGRRVPLCIRFIQTVFSMVIRAKMWKQENTDILVTIP